MKRPRKLAAAATVVLLTATGCASAADEGSSEGGVAELSFMATEPKSIVPQKDIGSQIGMALCANLMEVNVETQELEPLAAESVTSEDAQTWDITLRDGWTFHDGTAVTADSFASAWNATATGSNAWQGNGTFVAFEGYDELNPSDGSAPATETLSGVEVVDDTHLTVTLNAPNADFPKLLSTNPTCPLPASAFEDPAAYDEAPVSNGPYKFASWDHNQQIVLEKWEDFQGDPGFSGGADRLVGKIYTSIDPAYTDMTAGNLDMIRNVPAPMVEKASSQLGEEALFEVQTASKQQTLQIPDYIEELKSPDLRKAISMSIDREAIATSLLKGHSTPSDSLVPPSLASYREGACDACTFDPEEAKKLLESAGGFDGTLVIESNSASEQQLVQAVATQIQDNLGIKVKLSPKLGTELSERRNNQELEGALFGLWGWAYMSPDQYLSQYETGGDGNVATGYSNEKVDALMEQARGEQDEQASADLYAEAEALVIQDLPAIPLFIPTDYGLRSECAELNDVQGDLQYYRAGYAC
ncbi:peptide ABC transporter substrate-binding protein [Zhihengliuella halotolerans]|uniref:Peptide/nickel transport system substrate-binding protein/oligopeptide transport system substrate-binding protein n=1 Tax=Zhihengliuella halotolerans TaxID=370736 RepID=A0A4Q8ACR0_9MICC|nr:ABC transporter substrate-binding protein [Zhihengliuella halotolerans]RZU61997.1 peptide/nickel transport system substrate-binding protein/oligopeptide transport system substrate-binding protein [Zhihengliuella halotolerans]